MKWAAIILVILGCLVLAGLGYYLLFGQVNAPAPAEPSAGANPFGFAAGGQEEPSESQDTLTIEGVGGGSYVVPDFTKEEQPAWASETAGYQVAGDDDGPFIIIYRKGDAAGNPAEFLINLNSEPLGEVRRSAETELRNRLKLSDAEICMLDTQVWVLASVNATYSGRDLGLSFCQGSVKLP